MSDKEELKIPSISLSPMSNVCDDGDEKEARRDGEASEFGPKTHIRHFLRCFLKSYGLNVHEWANASWPTTEDVRDSSRRLH